MNFSVYTLGCKLNQLETEAITDAFRRQGFSLVSEGSPEAGIVIINTCTVTSMAEQKARRLIRKLLKDYPASFFIVTGCYAQLDKAAIEKEFPSRLIVIPGENKDTLLDLPALIKDTPAEQIGSEMFDAEKNHAMQNPVAQNPAAQNPAGAADRAFRFRPEKFSSHSRGFLKIQDGCDRHCSYCRVRLARGKSRSLGAEKVLEELAAMEKRGINEAVLTGVNITQYQDSFTELPELLEYLLKGTSTIRLRLSSIDPDSLNERFFDVISDERIRPHFHLSLQSGSAEILAKMGRPYAPHDIEKTLERFRSVRNDPFLACDIIAAFPGESEAEFEKTKVFCGKAGFAWIHAFPFSRRPGTGAYNLPERVNEKEAKRRVEILTSLAHKGRREYIERWKGREAEAIVEAGKRLSSVQGPAQGPGAFVPGVSENYLKLLIANNACSKEPLPLPGSLVKCRILEETPKDSRFDAFAEIIT